MNQEAVADALDELAHLCTGEGSMRRALVAWPARAPLALRRPLERLSARLEIGAPMSSVLAELRKPLGLEADVLTAIVKLHLSTGADPVAPLSAQAARIRADEGLRRRAAAGVAGVRASARLVGALPIACLLLLPLDRSPVGDPTGLILVGAGLALCATGFVWIRRSVPSPTSRVDRVAAVCDLMAGAIRAGSPPAAGLEIAVRALSGRDRAAFERALRLMRLGARMTRALQLTGEGDLCDLARVLDRSLNAGTPLAPALEAHAEVRRERTAAGLERALRQAPVKMLPALALCVLPASMLIGLGPFVRDLFSVF